MDLLWYKTKSIRNIAKVIAHAFHCLIILSSKYVSTHVVLI
jgi:hypothetical protein